MITEIATIRIKPGTAAAFEAAVGQAAPLFRRARGCRSMQLQRSLEEPEQYLLRVQWDTLEDHTVHFRASEDFQAWRALAGPYFGEPPSVQHVQVVVDGF